MIYKVSFGKARFWNEEPTKENTRSRKFNSEEKAWAFIDRLHKFTFKDKNLGGMELIAWTNLVEVNDE